MSVPVCPLEKLVTLRDDDLVRELWNLILAWMERHGSVTREGKVDPYELFSEAYNRRLIDIPDRFSDRLWDALATLSERGFVWFKHMGNPQQIAGGEPRFLAQYELTPKGRNATARDVNSGWPSDRGLLDRFPEHTGWDETMGAFFRMAVLTYERGVAEASVFLLGGAAERLLDEVEDRIKHLLPENWDKKVKKAGAAARVQGLEEFFRARGDHNTAELVSIVGNMARWNRNDVGHPRPTPPQVNPETVLTTLCNFRDYVSRVLAAADAACL